MGNSQTHNVNLHRICHKCIKFAKFQMIENNVVVFLNDSPLLGKKNPKIWLIFYNKTRFFESLVEIFCSESPEVKEILFTKIMYVRSLCIYSTGGKTKLSSSTKFVTNIIYYQLCHYR